MDALVVGCGSIGTRHIGNLLDNDVVSEVFGYDIDTAVARRTAGECGIWTTSDAEEAWSRSPDIVLVCTPPNTHLQVARVALDAGADVFIEKPLAGSLEGVPEFLDQVDRSDSTVMVGCNMRFHPPVLQIEEWLSNGRIGRIEYAKLKFGNHLSNWRSGDYSERYTAQARKGGGIILDGVHEIDLLLEWLSEPETVQCAASTYSDLSIDVEDTAEILVECPRQLGSIHLDCIRPERERAYELVGTDGMIVWQAHGKAPERSKAKLYESEPETWTRHSFELTLNEMYVSELEHFLDCVQHESSPVVDCVHARDALALALSARDAAETGCRKQVETNGYRDNA